MAASPEIGLNNQRPDLINTLGSILNFGNSALAYKKGVATLPADVASAYAQSQTAQQQAQQQSLVTLRMHMANGVQQALGMVGDPSKTSQQISDVITNTMQNAGSPRDAITQALSGLPSDDDLKQNPSLGDKFLANKALGAMSLMDQINSKFPSPAFVNTGQQIAPVAQGNPALTGVSAGRLQGQPIQQQLPPTTPTFNPATNTPSVLGPQARTGPVQTGPGLGMQIAAETNPKIMQDDFANTTATASKAQQNIGILQTIKQYAPGAVTGVESDRRSYLAGLAGLLGMTPDQLTKTNTDLLAKSSNMLALAGGNTDASRAIAESTNPNTHMTPQAIQHAADIVIAQQKMLLVKQQYMGQFINDPNVYAQKLSQFNKVADPRILQWQNMNLQEKTAMKSSMNQQERSEFSQKIKSFESMGLLK